MDWNHRAVTADTEGEIDIPESVVGNDGITYAVTKIGDFAFTSSQKLTKITIPNTVRHICQGAFAGCSGLTSMTIPKSVETIDQSVFSSCVGLTTFDTT